MPLSASDRCSLPDFQGGSSYCGPWQEQTGCVWEKYLPTDDIIVRESEALKVSQEQLRHKGSILNQNLRSRPDLFPPNKFYCMMLSVRTFCLSLRRFGCISDSIRAPIRLLCVHEEESFKLELLVFERQWQHDLNSSGWQCSEGNTSPFNMCSHTHSLLRGRNSVI